MKGRYREDVLGNLLGNVQGVVVIVLWVLLLGLKGFAFFDCLRAPTQVFPAVGRQSKILWLVLTGLAFLTGLVPGLTLSLFGIAGAVIALIYLFDIRPKIQAITGR